MLSTINISIKKRKKQKIDNGLKRMNRFKLVVSIEAGERGLGGAATFDPGQYQTHPSPIKYRATSVAKPPPPQKKKKKLSVTSH